MEELLRENLLNYIGIAIFFCIWIFLALFGIIIKTKKMEVRKIRIAICSIVGSILIFIFGYFIVYRQLYPVALANFEYNNNVSEETIGVVVSIKVDRNDRVSLLVEEEKYIIVYNNDGVYANIDKDIKKGDVVKIVFGEKSKFVFDIEIKRDYKPSNF